MAPGAGLVIRMSSWRVNSSRTGRRRASAAPATSGSTTSTLPPNPPPIVVPVTRTAAIGSPNRRASPERV